MLYPYKLILFIMFVFLITFIQLNATALEVAIDEIRTEPVIFVNYQGAYKKADSLQDIENIGKSLARNSNNTGIIRFGMKYSLINAISEEEPKKFSATIFSIDKKAKVGHIDIIRKILSAYLQQRYGYSQQHAKAIALFLTYYNAIYRGNIDYFSSKYKSIVIKYITKYNAGISTKYYEWPGATKMLIPLTEQPQKGKLDSILIDIISDKKILQEIRKDDKNIQARKDMVDIKEKILTQEKVDLEKSKKDVIQETTTLEENKKSIEQKKEELQQTEKEINKMKEEIKKEPSPEKQKDIQKDIETKEQQLQKQKEDIKKKEQEIAKKESEILDKKNKVSEKEERLAEKEKALEKEKEEIAADEIKKAPPKEKELVKKLEKKEKELDEREDKLRSKELDQNIYADKLYYLKIKEYLQDGHYNNEMVMIDPASRKILFKSPEKNICGSRYDIFSGGVVVITHKGSHAIGHRLTLLDRNSLEAKLYGSDNIFWRSFIIIKDGFIYAIVIENGKFYLGRFDTNLKMVSKSSEEVNENTFISFWDNFIYINRVDKTIMVLDKENLTLIDTIKP
ncbi:MAG TPA: P83/100 family protein [Spirochaetota bacterium]|nr:P83/100 family protein [Spirochaetota bacterium]HOM10667.1 P83/100 family protein [Spirochaetota bacterium]HPP50487.1 P83/100 family protein [Spirochaetota bacterium]